MRRLTYRGPPTALFMTAIYYVLFCLFLCCFHVSCFISKGHYAVSGPEYNGYTHEHQPEDELADYPIPEGVNPGLYCQRVCMRHENCHSFVIIKNETCSLKTLDTCTDFRYLLRRKNKVQYDMKNGDSLEPWSTCFRSCMRTKQDCNACGRGINCRGHLCHDCVNFCWEIDPPAVNKRYAFVNTPVVPAASYDFTYCDHEWQMIWEISRGPKTFNMYKVFLPQVMELKLQLRIVYENDEIKYSYFAGAIVQGTALSVGDILDEGDARVNNWNAPFSNRSILTPVDANCLPFFYDVDPCPTSGTYNDPTFIWPVDQNADALRITDMQLWVTLHNLTQSPSLK